MLTLARQIHRHPTKGLLVHVDFVRIDRDVAVSAEIPIHAVGEPEGVKNGGLLEQLLFQLTIEAMPGNIPVVDRDRRVGAWASATSCASRTSRCPRASPPRRKSDFVVAQVAAPRVATAGEGEEGEGEEGEAGEGGATEASAEASDDAGDE